MRRLILAMLTLATIVAVAPDAQAARPPARSPLRLTADAVVPGPGDAGGSGTFKLNMSRGELCYEVSVDNLSGYIERIAIHRGRAGFAGPEVALLSPSSIGIQGLWGCRAIDRNLAREIGRYPADFYLVVKTGSYPGGALRGQLQQ